MPTSFLCIKNTNICNLNCWYCSTSGNLSIPMEEVIRLYKKHSPDNMLLVGGESMLLGPEYYMGIMNAGCTISLQTNLTLYNTNWDKVLTHKNFKGLSVSGDKFGSVGEFIQKYLQVVDVMNKMPLVLVLLDVMGRKQMLDKASRWLVIANEIGMPIKLNYLVPSGKARGRHNDIPRISDVFEIYSTITDMWEDMDYKIKLHPFIDIINVLHGNSGQICPFIGNCVTKNPILDIEPDLEECRCPVIGDLGATSKELIGDTPYHPECLLCRFNQLCRGCFVRSWVVEKQEDTRYCESAKKLFTKLEKINLPGE